MENLDLVCSLFNQYVFQDAKNNIEAIDHYFSVHDSNPLIKQLVSAIRNYSFESIDTPLFMSILSRARKNEQEKKMILDCIKSWKGYSKQQIAPTKEYLKRIVAGSIISKAKFKFADDPVEFLKYIKNSEMKIDNSDVFESMNFDGFDVNAMLADTEHEGYPSGFPWINELFDPYLKYEAGQMIMVTMPPGCMSGNTRVFLSDGTIDTLENLEKSKRTDIGVIASDGEEEHISVAENCQISKYVESWYVVNIWGNEYKVTENHPFMLSNGTWKRADQLKIGDVLKMFDKNGLGDKKVEVEDVYVEKLNSPEPVYDLVNVKQYHNYSVCLDENYGFFSHNTGKTLFMMSEAIAIATNSPHAKIHYLAMGDMKPKDFIVRMGAIYTGKSFAEVTMNLPSIYSSMCQIVGKNLEISTVPAGVITVDDYVDYVKQKKFDVVFVDYDSNFRLKESDNMYNDFGVVYNSLTKLTQEGILVFIAAQPKIHTWVMPQIELGDVGESARKIHTVDVLFTAGKYVESPNHVGLLKCCKNRRGEEGSRIGYIRLNNGRFKLIPVDLAQQLGNEKEKRTYTEADVDTMVSQYNHNMMKLNNQTPSSSAQGQSRVINPFK